MKPLTQQELLWVTTLCGYCDQPLVYQEDGSWACPPCRAAMAAQVIGPTYEETLQQFAAFQRSVAPRHRRATA